MYPHQGYPGQYPNATFGSGYPPMQQPGMPQPGMPPPGMPPAGMPGIPQPGMPGMPQSAMPQPGMPQPGMPQPFGSGFPPQGPQSGFGQPAPYGQNPMPDPYGQNAPYGQSAPYGQPAPQTAPYGQPAPQSAPYGQAAPQTAPYGQAAPQTAPYGQPNPQMPSYGQNQPPYGQAPTYGQPGYQQQQPPVTDYSQPPNMGTYQQPQSAPSAYPQLPNFPAGQAQSPQHGNYGMPPQEQAIQAQQYNASYSSPTPAMSSPIRRGRPTIHPMQNFDASNDAAALRKAMKGFGTDEDALINVLCHRPSYQRVEIARCYKTAYGKDLIDDIRSETSGNFQNILVALLTPTVEYYCRELFEAMSGVGTDEDVLIEVMCTMSNQEIRGICQMYMRIYGQNLENQLKSDTSGSMKRLMTSLSVGGRDESMRTDVNAARADAESLKRAGIGRFGTDESEFNRILCLRNYEQLKLICQEYERLTGNSLEKDIKREFSGDIEDALLAIIRVAHNRPEFFARRLHKSMAGLGTNDRSLIRLCVTRAEIDMADVKDEFQRYYGKSLKSFIKGDTSGHYKHALYALCAENRS